MHLHVFLFATPPQRNVLKIRVSNTLPLYFFFSQEYTLIIQEEKYSHLRLRIKAPFHSGAFFKTFNYSFLEEGSDEAQAFSSNGMFPCLAGYQPTSLPANQSASPPGEAANQPKVQSTSQSPNQPREHTSTAKLASRLVRWAGSRPTGQSISEPASQQRRTQQGRGGWWWAETLFLVTSSTQPHRLTSTHWSQITAKPLMTVCHWARDITVNS